MRFAAAVTAIWLASASPAFAGEAPLYEPVPEWVPPVPESALAKPGNFLISDRLRHFNGAKSILYNDFAVRINSSEQLTQSGSTLLQWHPSKGDLIIHRAQIIRDGEIIDLTANRDALLVLRREQQIEQQWLSGVLTASLQYPGLRVGDIVRVSHSVTFEDPAQGGNVQLIEPMLSAPFAINYARLALLWPDSMPMRWQTPRGVSAPATAKLGKYNIVSFDGVLPKRPEEATDSPARYRLPPLFEASSFASWETVSQVAARHYDIAGTIAEGSALAERTDAIARAHADPLERMAAALRAVQDDIRYLFNGQAQGNYVPQSPAVTWEVRSGDCKAKTLLLMAMLDRLGIASEAVLVSATLGDAVPERLPSMGAFDHVVVRAKVDGRSYWLDGTTIGTRLADLGDTPTFRHALPLRKDGAGLEPIDYRPPARPLVTLDMTLDARAGLHFPKPYQLTLTLRDPRMLAARQYRQSMDAAQWDEAINALVLEHVSDVTVISATTTFDEEAGQAIIEARGLANRRWDREDNRFHFIATTARDGWELSVDRNRAAWRDIPFTPLLPQHQRDTIRIILPRDGQDFTLLNGEPVDEEIAGYRFRSSVVRDGATIPINDHWMSVTPEVPAAALQGYRQRLAAARANQAKLLAPADYPVRKIEYLTARDTGRLTQLDKLYAEAIAGSPDTIEEHINRALFRSGIGDNKGAAADYGRAIDIDPTAEALLGRARALRMTDPAAALADIDRALELESDNLNAMWLKIGILRHEGRYDEALGTIAELEAMESDELAYVPAKSEILASAGRHDEAVRLTDEANAQKPGRPTILNAQCWIRGIANRDLNTALKSCTEAIELADGSAIEALDSRSLIYFRMGRFDDALADLNTALKIEPDQAASLYLRGLVHRASGQVDAAKRDHSLALLLSPEIAREYEAYGLK